MKNSLLDKRLPGAFSENTPPPKKNTIMINNKFVVFGLESDVNGKTVGIDGCG